MYAWVSRLRVRPYDLLWLARRAMSTSVTEAQLRRMSKDELLQYSLRTICAGVPTQSAQAAAPVSAKRNPSEARGGDLRAKKKRRKDRPFDMSRYGQRMIALKFSYLGWHFHGLASQSNADHSVEDHLFSALLGTKLVESREDCDFSRAGRTDVGVSALGQVAGVRVRSNVVSPSTGKIELDYVKMINSMLPSQIRVLCWAPAPEGGGVCVPLGGGINGIAGVQKEGEGEGEGEKGIDGAQLPEMAVRRPGKRFDARFDAVYRSYKYFFAKGSLDVPLMRQAAHYFVGRHDFRNFCKMDVDKVTNFERTMFTVEVRRLEDDDPSSDPATDPEGEFTKYFFFVRGQAFLWHQIRCMVAVLFQVGLGHERPTIVKRMLHDATTGTGHFSRGKPLYHMAPPIPLLLYECVYPPSVVSFTVDVQSGDAATATSFAHADEKLACLYAEAAAQTAVAYTLLSWNDTVPMRMNGRLGNGVSSYGGLRGKRLLLPMSDSGKISNKLTHVTFDKRKQEPTLEVRLRTRVQKQTSRSTGGDEILAPDNMPKEKGTPCVESSRK